MNLQRAKYSKKLFGLALASVFGLASITVVSANEPVSADPDCVGAECELVVEFTGAPVSWQVPPGVQQISFDVQGAQGGSSGGLGGRVTGVLTNLPETLYFFVGGAGLKGANQPGGWGGGGASGANAQDEGSGGGASDIRSGLTLDSRIVVAGGGGGSGGWMAASGGAGGGLIGAAGKTGQGQGGAGGAQTEGGAGGNSNGGDNGTAGTFGIGGAGGVTTLLGGGGGGGGWFGGGGGGGDTDFCCLDGGGGGGGSSYTAASASAVQHTQGARTGNGRIVINFAYSPEIVGVSLTQTGVGSAQATVEFSQAVQAFDAALVVATGCEVSTEGQGSSWLIKLSGCVDELGGLIIQRDAAIGAASGPSTDFALDFELDLTAPTATWSQQPGASEGEFTLLLSFSEPVAYELGSIAFEGDALCDQQVTHSQTELEIALNCGFGVGSFTLAVNALSDAFGNQGPAEVLSYGFERLAPEPEPTPEPEVTEPEVTEPEVTEPEATEPEVTEPEVSEPAVTEPEVVTPDTAEIEQPATISPSPPVQSAPTQTAPVSTAPVSTAPVETTPKDEVTETPDPLSPETPLTPSAPANPETPETPEAAESDPAGFAPAESMAAQDASNSTTEAAWSEGISEQQVEPLQSENLLVSAEEKVWEVASPAVASEAEQPGLSPMWLLGSAAIGTALAAGSIVAWRRRGV